eukprot:XP_001708963.1 Hypothetical protein GL50803_10403 [Giardia lamblia ATCC 50803]
MAQRDPAARLLLSVMRLALNGSMSGSDGDSARVTVWQDRPVPVLGRLSSGCLPRPVRLTLEMLVRCIPQQCAVTQQENRLYSSCRPHQAGNPCSSWHMGGAGVGKDTQWDSASDSQDRYRPVWVVDITPSA